MEKTIKNSKRSEAFVYYKRRYLILLLLGLYMATNYFQHFEYVTIDDLISSYYDVKVDAVDWTALLFNVGLLGANWFKSEHIATVNGVNFAFSAFGCAIAFLFPVLIFDKLETKLEISNAIFWISIVLAAMTTLIFVLSMLIVRSKPKTPPSFADQSRDISDADQDSVLSVLRDKNYILLLIMFSIAMSLSQVITIVLNQATKAQFDKIETNLILTISGILGVQKET
ncbi:hypothetical protein B4U79_14516 [Dinothrombium tinctorium]|uniref:MFS transporter n=1 Tax=Dinothrombium tinctorium TaxID=1965070 RepID=A0A443QAA7_9ACAR|nr:hypothetical protein B4U79_18728 [Dinothrombium tinctorium]RWR99943.1 hypothetical protein B4U79_14516 [Dinothrombium tinctorium]